MGTGPGRNRPGRQVEMLIRARKKPQSGPSSNRGQNQEETLIRTRRCSTCVCKHEMVQRPFFQHVAATVWCRHVNQQCQRCHMIQFLNSQTSFVYSKDSGVNHSFSICFTTAQRAYRVALKQVNGNQMSTTANTRVLYELLYYVFVHNKRTKEVFPKQEML